MYVHVTDLMMKALMFKEDISWSGGFFWCVLKKGLRKIVKNVNIVAHTCLKLMTSYVYIICV